MATAIAHFSCVPNRRVSTTEQVGVVAFSKGGITRVDFQINGGTVVPVTTRTKVTDTDVKGKTVTHYEYQIEFDPSLYADGAVTFDALVVATTDTNRQLTQITLHANTGGTLDGNIIYLTNVSNPGGDGSSGNPYDTPKAALTASNVNGGDIIELMVGGTYDFDILLAQLDSRRADLDYWTTIRGAAGLNHHNVIIGHTTKGLCRLNYDRIKFQHLSFDPAQISSIYLEDVGYTSNPERIGDTYWLEDVYLNDSGGWANPGTYNGTFFRLPTVVDGVYVTNSEAYDVVFGFAGCRFQRNSHQRRVSSDAYKGDICTLNCSTQEMIGTIRTLIDGAHADLCQVIGTPDNVLFYNVECTDLIDVQGIHFDETGLEVSGFSNVAFINYSARIADSAPFCSILGASDHVLMYNVSIPNQGLGLRDQDATQPFSATDFDIRNSIFEYIAGDTAGALTGVTVNDSHTVTVATQQTGTGNTLGAVDIADVGLLGSFEYIGVDLADITNSGGVLADVTVPTWIYGSPATPNKGAWPQSAWTTEAEVSSMSNQVQRDFINNAARPHVEAIIHILHELDSFVADYDALQATGDALALDAAVLNDGDDSTPRLDAPNLTGADIQTMRALSASMSLVVDATSRQSLIGKMVRNLTTVLKIN